MSKGAALLTGLAQGYTFVDNARRSGEKDERDKERFKWDQAEAGFKDQQRSEQQAMMEADKAARLAGRAAMDQSQPTDELTMTAGRTDQRPMEERLEAASNAAFESYAKSGYQDKALAHFEQGYKLRTELRTRAFEDADRSFAANGDYNVYVPIFNKYVRDGQKVTSISPQQDGNFLVKVTGPDGKTQDVPAKPADMKNYLDRLRDPKEVRTREAQYAFELFKRDVGRKPGDNFEKVKDADGNERLVDLRDPQQVRDATAGLGSGTGSTRRDLPVLKEIDDSALRQLGKYDVVSGKHTTTPEYERVAPLANRIWMANKNLDPNTVVTIARSGKVQMQQGEGSDGKTYERAVIVHDGQTYSLANTASKASPNQASAEQLSGPTDADNTAGVKAPVTGADQLAGPAETAQDNPVADARREQSKQLRGSVGQRVTGKIILPPREPGLGDTASAGPAGAPHGGVALETGEPPDGKWPTKYNAAHYDHLAARAEEIYKLPPNLIKAIKNSGERSNNDQTSEAGAKGVMQFIPQTAKAYNIDPKDPVQAIDGAARYFADMLKRYGGNVKAAIAEYHGGSAEGQRVARGEEPKGPRTKAYVNRVMQSLQADGEQDGVGLRDAVNGSMPKNNKSDRRSTPSNGVRG